MTQKKINRFLIYGLIVLALWGISFGTLAKTQEACYQETEWLKQTMIFLMKGIPEEVLHQAVEAQERGSRPNDPLTKQEADIIRKQIKDIYTNYMNIKDPNKYLEKYYLTCLSTVEANN